MRERDREREGEREVFSNRNEASRSTVDSSVGLRLSLLSSKHSAMQNSPKPVIRLHFEHQGNSFTSRSDSLNFEKFENPVQRIDKGHQIVVLVHDLVCRFIVFYIIFILCQ